MSFMMLPPEINSALIYAGAGVLPLCTAAAAWDGLAAELRAAASAFDGAVASLTSGPWMGPASTMMAAAAAPYAGWMTSAARHAESAAGQARAAVTVFDTALTATVHPAAVMANRMSLMSLVTTNFLGQNTSAIAATDLDYERMWAQDVSAMVGYRAGAASVASALAPLAVPPAVVTDVASQAVNGISSALQSVVTAVPLDSLSSLAQVATLPVSMLLSPMMSLAQSANGAGVAAATSLGADAPALAGNVTAATPPVGAGGLGSTVAADLGRGRLVGALSVPPAWTGSVPARMTPTPVPGLAGLPAGATGATGTGGLGGMPMMPMPIGGAGAGVPGGMLGRSGGGSHVVQQRPSVIPRTGVG
ncbi:PPE family protein [Mycobacterium asiaticum]|uniref:PPE family domain-containing protein n=1 Tax=Mycobacterium asiaticum TaxID=1790 RepID=A0A1A3N3A0_MYCAS|nr:PPE family protein [Mycobacterium asiaticum]OBK14847.1 hypothetical protein A5636_07080 [Mycobacterium asiaticum]